MDGEALHEIKNRKMVHGWCERGRRSEKRGNPVKRNRRVGMENVCV